MRLIGHDFLETLDIRLQDSQVGLRRGSMNLGFATKEAECSRGSEDPCKASCQKDQYHQSMSRQHGIRPGRRSDWEARLPPVAN